MADISALEKEYDYTIEVDDGSEYVRIYFTNVIDTENSAFMRFDPLYVVAKDEEKQVDGKTMMIPYERVLSITKRKPE